MMEPLDCTELERLRSSGCAISWVGDGTTEFFKKLSLSFLLMSEVGFLILD